MTTAERWWLWSQPLVAAIALLAGIAAWILQAIDQYALLPSVQSVVTGTFVLPGLGVSLALNHVIVLRRAVPVLTSGEKLLLVAQYALAIIVVFVRRSPRSTRPKKAPDSGPAAMRKVTVATVVRAKARM